VAVTRLLRRKNIVQNIHLRPTFMKVMPERIPAALSALPLVVLAMLAYTAAAAPAATIPAADDTYITEYGDPLGDANSTHGSATSLYSISSPPWEHWACFPLIRFDLSAYAGQTVQGPATLSMYVQGTDFGIPYIRQESVHRVLVAWSGDTVSFNSFGASPGVQEGNDIGAALDTIEIEYPGAGDRYVTWTLSAALLQEWIDSPSSNHGLLLFNHSAGDLQFGSTESAHAPLLTVAVPEPDAFGVIGLAALGLTGLRRRWSPSAA
jgi:hypothetical protein